MNSSGAVFKPHQLSSGEIKKKKKVLRDGLGGLKVCPLEPVFFETSRVTLMNIQGGNHCPVHPMTPEGIQALEPNPKLIVASACQGLGARTRLSQQVDQQARAHFSEGRHPSPWPPPQFCAACAVCRSR